eukprot:1160875-Pelagomonas_calceolata.AAC.2
MLVQELANACAQAFAQMVRQHSPESPDCRAVVMWLHTLTSAPITPRLVSRRYSKGRVLLDVFRKGYRNKGMCAASKRISEIAVQQRK